MLRSVKHFQWGGGGGGGGDVIMFAMDFTEASLKESEGQCLSPGCIREPQYIFIQNLTVEKCSTYSRSRISTVVLALVQLIYIACDYLVPSLPSETGLFQIKIP